MSHPIPAGHHAITPHLIIKGASEAIEFYKRAFGAKELSRMPFPAPDGQVKLGHAELQIGDSRLFLSDEFPQQGGHGPGANSPVTMHLYVTDADAAFARCRGWCKGGHASGRHVLGRSLRQAGRSVRTPLVYCRAPGRLDSRADERADGRRHGGDGRAEVRVEVRVASRPAPCSVRSRSRRRHLSVRPLAFGDATWTNRTHGCRSRSHGC